MGTESRNDPQVLLQMDNIGKRFGGTVALSGVSLRVNSGSILALLGENGAGKSTLIKILAGVYPKDTGEIRFRGKKISSAKAIHDGHSCPISFIHQDLGLVDWMTIAENIALTAGFPRRWHFLVDWSKAAKKAKEALAVVGLDVDPLSRIFELSRAEKTLVAIARALVVEAQIIVLDEPTASLPAADVEKLFLILRRLKSEGLGMVYVSHRLDEIKAVSDEVAVLRDGQLVATGKTASCSPKDLVRLIVGQEKISEFRRPAPVDSPVVCQVTNLVVGSIGPVTFQLRKGEMLGIAGLRGAGQVEIGRSLFGCHPRTSGTFTLEGKSVDFASPQEAIAQGLSLVGSDRIAESLCTGMSVAENLFLNPTNSGKSLLGFRSLQQELSDAGRLITKLDVRPNAPHADIESLSGGNQQKVVIARWMNIGTPVLILEDPTAGVDVGSRFEIYKLLDVALDSGISVIVISTDFEEIAKICRRTLVFKGGKVVQELCDDQVTFENLLYHASASSHERIEEHIHSLGGGHLHG